MAYPIGRIFARIMRVALPLIAALIVIVPVASYAQDRQPPDTWIGRYVRSEAATLAASSEVAQRTGEVLLLKLRDRVMELKDSTDCDGDGARCEDGGLRCTDDVGECRSYSLMRHEKTAAAFVVLVGFWEGHTVYWIDEATAHVTDIKSEPHLSPDGAHFAVVQYVDAYSYSGIQVWRTKGPELVAEYHELNGYPTGPRIYANFIRWLDNNSFLIVVNWNNHTSGFTSIVNRGGVWAFERPPATETPPIICSYGRAELNDTTGMTLLLKLDDGAACIEDKSNTQVETEVKHCVFSASASPCENIEIPRVR